MRTHDNRRQHLPACRTILSLRKVKASAGIGDNHFLIPLKLVQNSPHCIKTGIRDQKESSIIGGKTQYGSTYMYQASFQSFKRHLLSVCPNEGGPLPRQCHQRLRQPHKILNKSAIISHKTHKLAYCLNFVWRMPVPLRSSPGLMQAQSGPQYAPEKPLPFA